MNELESKIAVLTEELSDETNENAYKASDALGRIGSEEVVDAMIELLAKPGQESRIMAARTLGLVKDTDKGIKPILEAVQNEENKGIAGDLLMALEDLDVSNEYVILFKLYLFGTFKVSFVAKGFLDFKEFDITQRTVRKAEKHWKHYSNNVKHDESYDLKKIEVEEMLDDLRNYLE